MADSILKDLFNDIKTALGTITEIGANVDIYMNQIAALSAFPFIYIDYPYVYYKDASAKVQMGNAMIRIMLCMDATSPTLVTDVFELKDKVYAKLQGLKNLKCSQLSRGTERTETKYEGIYVFEMDFYSTVQDDGVYRLKTFVNANDPAVNSNINLEDDDLTNDHVQLEINKGDVRGVVPPDEGRIGLIIDNLSEGENNEIRTGKIIED